MQKWFAGGVLTAAAFGSVYLATPPAKVDAPASLVSAADRFTRSAPLPADDAPPPPVVDVTDISPLLDPPAEGSDGAVVYVPPGGPVSPQLWVVAGQEQPSRDGQEPLRPTFAPAPPAPAVIPPAAD